MTRTPLLAAAMLLAAACSTDLGVDVDDVAGGVAPPPDAVLAEVNWPDAAAWISRETTSGRPVVVKLFAEWCGPCRDEAVVILGALDRYPNVTFLGVDHEDVLEKGRTFLEETGLDRIPTLFDQQGETARAGLATGMPSTLFFDRDGVLVETHVGPLLAEDLDRILDGLSR